MASCQYKTPVTQIWVRKRHNNVARHPRQLLHTEATAASRCHHWCNWPCHYVATAVFFHPRSPKLASEVAATGFRLYIKSSESDPICYGLISAILYIGLYLREEFCPIIHILIWLVPPHTSIAILTPWCNISFILGYVRANSGLIYTTQFKGNTTSLNQRWLRLPPGMSAFCQLLQLL